PRTRGDDGGLWNAGRGAGFVLSTLHGPGKSLERPRRKNQLLVAQHRACMDGLCNALSIRCTAALSFSQCGIFRRAFLEVSLQPHERHAGVAETSWRCPLHSRRNLARALPLLAWGALYESANRVGTCERRIIH